MVKHANDEKTLRDLQQARDTVIKMMVNPGITDKQAEQLAEHLDAIDDEIRAETS